MNKSSSLYHDVTKGQETANAEPIPTYEVKEFVESNPLTNTLPKFEKRFTHARYNALVEKTFNRVLQLSALKGGEYSGDDDRLANFRRNAAGLGLKQEQVWAVYAAKHWDAIMQYIKDVGENKHRVRMESIDGRVDDLIVYLLLFKAMYFEAIEESPKND